MTLSTGSVLADRYRLIRPLGEGGMGEVWAATHTVTGRPVALKRLRLSLDSRPNSDARARFVLEAQAACAVDHPNVVEILDFVEVPDEPPVIVMELLLGETLASKLIRESALSSHDTARVLLPVVSAVGTAHARGIIHRDLKPENIFLSEVAGAEPIVKVLDFGIAKFLMPKPGEAALRTQTGSTLGTPCYMSPEQAMGQRVLDHRVDIWALGVILYECLSGARPVEGENAAHIMVRLMRTGIIPIERLVSEVPPALAALVRRMLSRDPAKRPADLREVLSVLGAFANVSVPSFGEPAVETAAERVGLLSGTDGSAPSVAWGQKTPPPTLNSEADAPYSSRIAPSELGPRGTRVGLVFGGLGAALAVGALLSWRTPTPAIGTAAILKVSPSHATVAEVPKGTSSVPEPAVSAEQPRPAKPPPDSETRISPALLPKPKLEALAATPVKKVQATPIEGVASAVGSASPAAPPVASSALASGAPCERSRECASQLCVAFVCE